MTARLSGQGVLRHRGPNHCLALWAESFATPTDRIIAKEQCASIIDQQTFETKLSDMNRLSVLIALGSLYAVVAGGYEFFIQSGAAKEPTTVSVAELQKAMPSNRHIILTGGRLVLEDAVRYYKTRSGAKLAGSDIYFIPVKDAELGELYPHTPPVLLRIDAPQMQSIKSNNNFRVNAIQGVRMTHWELEDKAEERLVEKYGKAAVDKMVILQYLKDASGVGESLGKMSAGALLLAVVVLAGSRKPKLG